MQNLAMKLLGVLAIGCLASGAQAGVTSINVGNFVWNDVDGDGIQDASEPGMSGVTVQLWNDARTMLIAQTTTNTSGNYTLLAPGAGSYRVRVVLPLSSDAFSPKDAGGNDLTDSDINPAGGLIGFTDTITLASNVISTTIYDAGIVRAPVAIGDRVWNDYDGDGLQDSGEPGIAGAAVELWDASRTLTLSTTTTDAAGNYELQAPGAGSYRVRVLKSSADAYSPKDVGASDLLDSDIHPGGAEASFTDVLTVTAASTSVDAGIVRAPINIGNFIWNDVDRDGVQDASEPGLAGVIVQLWNAARTQVLDSTTSSATGTYLLQAPGAGDYRVRVVLPTAGDTFSPLDAPPSDLTDSDINPSGGAIGFTNVYTFASSVISTTNIDGGIETVRLFRNGFE
jgi:hypothetical protein